MGKTCEWCHFCFNGAILHIFSFDCMIVNNKDNVPLIPLNIFINCDGVVDIGLFTYMNGIVTEAIYPVVIRDYRDKSIRIFYFNAVPVDLDSDLEIFIELVKSYCGKRI